MQYSKTGQFTANQEKICREIARLMRNLRRSGCSVYGKGNELHVYKTKDMEHAQPLHRAANSDYSHPLKYISAGFINDSGADDSEYFEQGYITEE